MKKLLRLTKTLLVAAGLLAGGNAWADLTEGSTTTVNFNGQTTPFVIYDAARLGVSYELQAGSQTDYYAKYSCGNKNALPFAAYDMSTAVTKAVKVVVSFDCCFPNDAGIAYIALADKDIHNSTNGGYNVSSRNSVYGNNGAIFGIGRHRGKPTGSNTTSNYMRVNYTDKNSALSIDTWYTVNVTVDLSTQKVSYIVKARGGSETLDSGTDLDYWNTGDGTKATACNQIDISMPHTGNVYIDNISITPYTDESEKYAGYTIKYMYGNTELKSAVTDREEVKVGETATLIPSDKAPIVVEGVKYVYDSDDSSTQTIKEDGSTVITVNFREANTYTYTVANNLGDDIASGSVYEGDDVSYYVPYYVFKADRFYQSPSVSSGTLSYGKGTISSITANTDITVTYTEEESTNVVFYSEAENLSGVNVVDDGYTQIRMSNGKTGYFDEQTAFVTLPAGVYTITTSTRSGTTRFYAGAVGEGVEVATVSSNGNVQLTTSDAFTLPTSTTIYCGTGNESNYFDYIIIRKTADLPANQSVTVTDAGYATLVSNYNLDFSEATIKAYKVSVAEKGKAVLEEVSKVPAKTPVVLVKDGGATENIPVTTEAIDAVTGNDLVAGTGAEVATVDGGYTNMILNKYGDKACFMFANGQTVAADKAYLHIASSLAPDAEDGARMAVLFFDEVTGISSVKAEKVANGQWFNLAGQRVMQPTKGLYIVNGKKVSVK